jgi:hypothetical protein
MQEIRIPALTTLKTDDATAVRAIVFALIKEIESLRRDVESLKKTREDVYVNRMMSMKGRRA